MGHFNRGWRILAMRVPKVQFAFGQSNITRVCLQAPCRSVNITLSVLQKSQNRKRKRSLLTTFTKISDRKIYYKGKRSRCDFIACGQRDRKQEGSMIGKRLNMSGCWRCGKEGHLARNCPEKKQPSSMTRTSRDIAWIGLSQRAGQRMDR